jgi:uroporphyrinogen-III synthase
LKPRILITRPEPGAARTAERLREIGFEPVVLPLTRIVRLAFEIPESEFDGLVVTSAQALNGGDFSRLSFLPMIAVGEMTAKAALAAGFSDVLTANGFVESVAKRAIEALKPGARLLYICGKVRRPELETLLRTAGFFMEAVETYCAAPVEYAEGALAEALGGEPFDAVVLMSAVAAELFGGLAARPQLQHALLVCFSPRIADAAKGAGSLIAVTREATEESLMDLLQSRFPEAR